MHPKLLQYIHLWGANLHHYWKRCEFEPRIFKFAPLMVRICTLRGAKIVGAGLPLIWLHRTKTAKLHLKRCKFWQIWVQTRFLGSKIAPFRVVVLYHFGGCKLAIEPSFLSNIKCAMNSGSYGLHYLYLAVIQVERPIFLKGNLLLNSLLVFSLTGVLLNPYTAEYSRNSSTFARWHFLKHCAFNSKVFNLNI